MRKRIEYCCGKETALNICHHNIKVNNEKFRIVDYGCNETKESIKDSINNDVDILTEGWILDCDDEENCELLQEASN